MPRRGDPSTLRLLDAAANRAREGLRVVEDAARFALGDARLVEELKAIRHGLADALGRLGIADAIAHRDTPGDVGTSIGGAGEYERAGARGVVVAAGKRAGEALRSLEEFGKAIDPAVAREIEGLRYRMYSAEKRAVLGMGAARSPQWRLCVLLTESLCAHHPWEEVARLAIEAGADCLQLREKNLEGAELVRRARALIELARPRGASVVVNDRVDVALAAGADGVHVGQHDLAVEDIRRAAGFGLLVGVSTSRIEEAERALRDGADGCGVGPMFATATKHKDEIVGPAYLRAYVEHAPPLPPHLAIGGITPANVGELAAAGVRGVAVSSAVCGVPDPADAVARLLEALPPAST